MWSLVILPTDIQTIMAPISCTSDVTTTMLLVHLALLYVAACFDVQVEGDLALDLRVPNSHSGNGHWLRVGWEMGSQVTQELTFRMSRERKNVTVAPQVECVYQYPEEKHVDALLSDMMNVLTKVFVRANEYVNGLETRRSELNKAREGFTVDVKFVMRRTANTSHESKKEENEESVNKTLRDPTRFKVVHKKKKPFIERIYNNMTDEYRTFYNTTSERVNRSGRDPCMHQTEVKQLWSDLLEQAQLALRSATHRCVNEYLRNAPVEKEAQVRESLKQYLKTELGKVRTNQLNMLCDSFQLCYNDLL